MTGFKNYIIGFLVLGLFSLSIITYGILLANNNGATQSIGDLEGIQDYANSLNNTLIDSSDTYNGSLESISTSPISQLSDSIIFTSVGAIWKTMKSIPILVYDGTIGLMSSQISSPSFIVITSVLASIITILIIFSVVYWVRQGSGEGS